MIQIRLTKTQKDKHFRNIDEFFAYTDKYDLVGGRDFEIITEECRILA